jgi:hypothetical protein
MEADFAAIRDGLQQLRTATVPLNVFGSHVHRFRTHPRLSEGTVGKFEAHHRVALPPEYRGFLMQVGNGGAGPAYGLFKLGEIDDMRGHKPWTENSGLVGVLSQPFPHTGPWNDVSEEPLYDESRADDPEWEEEYERKRDAWEDRVYWNPANVNGAVPICHLGCALRQWLVVTGPEAGNVWDDDRTDHGGLKPHQHKGRKRVTFLQWYRFWLDDALRQLKAAGASRPRR